MGEDPIRSVINFHQFPLNPLPHRGGRRYTPMAAEAIARTLNPLPHRGGRRSLSGQLSGKLFFKSTSPPWGKTCHGFWEKRFWDFKSTSPPWGKTGEMGREQPVKIFKSTSPPWGKTLSILPIFHFGFFKSTSPPWGKTWGYNYIIGNC